MFIRHDYRLGGMAEHFTSRGWKWTQVLQRKVANFSVCRILTCNSYFNQGCITASRRRVGVGAVCRARHASFYGATVLARLCPTRTRIRNVYHRQQRWHSAQTGACLPRGRRWSSPDAHRSCPCRPAITASSKFSSLQGRAGTTACLASSYGWANAIWPMLGATPTI